jgi:hypothetical protein
VWSSTVHPEGPSHETRGKVNTRPERIEEDGTPHALRLANSQEDEHTQFGEKFLVIQFAMGMFT